MKNKILVMTLNLSILTMSSFTSVIADTVVDHNSHTTDTTHTTPASKDMSSPELNRIKSLKGRWKSTTSMFGKENEEVFTEYKVTAGGSAVVETTFPGTSQEMVSVYYDDDKGKLAMTHYCMMRNRPQFRIVHSGKDEIKLGVTKVEGLKSNNEPSMGSTTIKFIDKNHFSSTCDGSKKSADQASGPMVMTFTRVN